MSSLWTPSGEHPVDPRPPRLPRTCLAGRRRARFADPDDPVERGRDRRAAPASWPRPRPRSSSPTTATASSSWPPSTCRNPAAPPRGQARHRRPGPSRRGPGRPTGRDRAPSSATRWPRSASAYVQVEAADRAPPRRRARSTATARARLPARTQRFATTRAPRAAAAGRAGPRSAPWCPRRCGGCRRRWRVQWKPKQRSPPSSRTVPRPALVVEAPSDRRPRRRPARGATASTAGSLNGRSWRAPAPRCRVAPRSFSSGIKRVDTRLRHHGLDRVARRRRTARRPSGSAATAARLEHRCQARRRPRSA